MHVVYYPDLYVYSEETLKALLLCWSNILTIVPPSEMDFIQAYLAGNVKDGIHYPLEKYKRILDLAGEPVVDFLVISDEERKRASEKMFDLICNWNKHTSFYESLRINSVDDLIGKWISYYWFLHEKLEQPLVELLLEERLVVNLAPGEIVGYEEVGKSYMSIIAQEIRNGRSVRLLTDDEFSVGAKSGIDHAQITSEDKKGEGYQLVSIAIPQVFIGEHILKKLSWKKVIEIRKDLLPLAESYHRELENYQQLINKLEAEGKDDEAYEKFCEFCERIAISFRSFSKEATKILRLISHTGTLAFITSVALPAIRLIVPQADVSKVCDITVLSLAASKYMLPKVQTLTGFEYLENLHRKLVVERMKNVVTCLIPKTVKEIFSQI